MSKKKYKRNCLCGEGKRFSKRSQEQRRRQNKVDDSGSTLIFRGNIKIFLTGENGRKSCSRKKKEEEKRGSDCKWLPTQTRTALVRWTRVQQGPQVSQQRHSFNLYQLLLIRKPYCAWLIKWVVKRKFAWYSVSISWYCLVLGGTGSAKGLYACIYWKSGDLVGCYQMPHRHTDRQQNIGLLSLSPV